MSDPITTPTDEEEIGRPSIIPVYLTAYDWGLLMENLKHDLRICNVNQRHTVVLLENIGTQLNDGKPLIVIHEDNPNPERRPKKPEVKFDLPKRQLLNESGDDIGGFRNWLKNVLTSHKK